MVATSSTPTTLDRGASSGTSATNTTASTRNSDSTTTTTANIIVNKYDQNRDNHSSNNNDDVFIEQSTEAQNDSMLAESIIRFRTQLHRDESSRESFTLSQNSAELFSSNEFDGSTISSTKARPAKMSSASSAAISCDLEQDRDVASTSPRIGTEKKDKEQARLPLDTPQPLNGLASDFDELNASMELVNKQSANLNVHEDDLPGGMTPQTISSHRPHVVDGSGSNSNGNNSNRRTYTDDMMHDTHRGVDASHVNHVPIVAFSVPDVAPPVHAIPVLSPDDDDNDYNSNEFHSGADKLQKKQKKKHPKSRRSIVAIVFLCLIASVILTAVLTGSICGSGAVTCGRSPSTSSGNSNSKSESPNNKNNSDTGKDNYDDRAVMIYDYINSMSFLPDSDASAKVTPPNASSSASLKEKAMDWMIYSDPLQLNLTESQNDFFRIRQRYALAALWFHTSINDTWMNYTGWLSNTHECSWYGIVCTEIDHGDDIGIQNTVTGVNTSANNMNGRIPADLAFLSNLQLLNFGFNAISGTIPESLGQCTDLEQVELVENNLLTGTLPDSIGNWTKIIHFDISYNSLSGSVPSTLGNWMNVKNFSASSNLLYSTLPSTLGLWNSIEFFDFNLNRLYGTLPESIGNWPSIRAFAVLRNNLSGTIPTTIGQWTNLFLLALSDNHFTGTIPDVIGTFENLDIVKIEKNGFTGSVPEGLCAINITELIANCTVICDCCTGCY